MSPFRRYLEEGTDPDPRFTFANERTYLAWVRTALALLAGGIGVDTFLVDLPTPARRGLASLLLVLGAVLAATAYRRWLLSERAMRTGASLPPPAATLLLTGGVALAAVVLLVLVLVTG